MRRSTMVLHTRAEQTGVIAALLQGHITQPRYALYLRNLLPAYEAMELALRLGSQRPELQGLVQPAVYRSESIIADLENLIGPGWAASLPLLPSGRAYAARVEFASSSGMLIAHCYTRTLGDLNGGQIIGRRLTQLFGPDFPALAFTTFPEIKDLGEFRHFYRERLDRAGDHMVNWNVIVDEAVLAFEMNIDLSIAVGRFD